ncbi:MAG: SusC/RagA family TonB-linked outer membrane protein [Bacteroidia bacterium]|nr:SusC/RagA family TonB-linked outer membrane protein [Bacteroidia bacterium]
MFKNIIIALLAFLLMGMTAYGQESRISGTVKDSDGKALGGVTVFVKGNTGQGRFTDDDGKFSIVLPNAKDATLVFVYYGMEQQEVALNGRTQLDVVMKPSVETLDEVVISAIGLEQNGDNIGSTVSKVSSTDVVRSGETLLLNGLAGKASNLKIARSNGEPGAGTTIQIRGANTITGSSSPLIILDGVPIDNSTTYGGGDFNSNRRIAQSSRLNDLNPNDIESIQILKGASAASLWGSRAANGVVVITTKKGKAGTLSISLNSTVSLDQILTQHPLQTTFGQGDRGVFSASSANSWGDKISERSGEGDLVTDQAGRFVSDGVTFYPILEKRSTDIFTDRNFNDIFRTGYYVNNNIQISGGNERSQFFLSLGRLDHEGIIENSFFDKTNLTFNSKSQLADWLTVKAKANFVNSQANKINQSSNVAGLYIGLLRTPPDFYNRYYLGTYIDESGLAFPNRHRAYRDALGATGSPAYNNPLWTVNEQRVLSNVNRLIASSEVNITPTKRLNFTLRGGVDHYGDIREYFFPIGTANSDYNLGRFDEDNISRTEVNFDVIGRTNLDLFDGLRLNITAGWNFNNRSRFFNTTSLTAFQVDVSTATSQLNTANENTSFTTRRAFRRSNRGYSVLTFDILEQVYVNVSNTLEASSTLNGSFYYPAVDVAWQFSDILDWKAMDFGKLRVAWGQVGVDAAAHRAQTLAEGGFSYSTFGDPLDVSLFGGGFRVDDDKGNANLRPEVKTEFEIGTDLRFFQNKLTLSFTYYQNEINDLLYEINTAASTGFLSEYKNIGTMENRGYEAEVVYNFIRKKDWNLEVYGNFSRNRNRVTNLFGATSIALTGGAISSRAVEGQALGVLWGTRALRDDDGNLVLNENGFPRLNSEQGVIGDPNPDWRAGLGLRARWKKLSVNLLFDHSQGGDFAERTKFVLYRFGTHEDVGNEVTLEQNVRNINGDVFFIGETVRGNLADFGAGTVLLDESWYTTIGGGFLSSVINEFSISDATWTRLREASVAYSFSGERFKRLTKLSSIQFGVTGRNLILWTRLAGVDPEVNQFGVGNGFGIDYFTNPTTRSLIFNLNITY